MNIFRELSPEEVADFKAWARENYEPLSRISPVWHPVVQEECHLINNEIAEDLSKIDTIPAEHYNQ